MWLAQLDDFLAIVISGRGCFYERKRKLAMSLMQRFNFSVLFISGGWLFVGFMMEANGSASRYNPAWRLIGPFYGFLLMLIKWTFFVGVALGVIWLVVMVIRGWHMWRIQVADETM